MIRTAPKMIAASSRPRSAAEDLVREARLPEQLLRLVVALAISASAITDAAEDRPEPDHVAVLAAGTGSSGRRGTRPSVSARLAAKQEREQHRADADQPADRALGKPEHEEPDEVQDDEQVDGSDPADELPEVHGSASMDGRSRSRPAPEPRKGSSADPAAARERRQRGGSGSGQVRSRPPTSVASPRVTRVDRAVDIASR